MRLSFPIVGLHFLTLSDESGDRTTTKLVIVIASTDEILKIIQKSFQA